MLEGRGFLLAPAATGVGSRPLHQPGTSGPETPERAHTPSEAVSHVEAVTSP